MKHVLNVVLPDEAARRLAAIAEREFRRPRDQASVLLIDAIDRASLDTRSHAKPELAGAEAHG